jgi:hypothetical protein
LHSDEYQLESTAVRFSPPIAARFVFRKVVFRCAIRSAARRQSNMGMAMRSPSPALQYPDSDAEQENDATVFANDGDDEDQQDQMVVEHSRLWSNLQDAMQAMEVELHERKKGQVIQHRHVSPPLPSSSQPAGIYACVREAS